MVHPPSLAGAVHDTVAEALRLATALTPVGAPGTVDAETVMVIGGVTAGLPTPLLADTVNVKDPVVVGVPESTPVAAARPRPGGRAPLATAKVGAGLPLAWKV